MKKLYLLFTTCMMLLLGNTAKNVPLQNPTNPTISHEVKKAADPLDKYQVVNVPDYLVPGNKTKTTLKSLGLPTSISLPDFDAYRNSESFDITGLHYTRTLSNGVYSQPTLAGPASNCATVETVYLGPVRASDETSETRNNNQPYTQFTSAKTLLIYDYTYLSYIFRFPEVENIVFLTNEIRLANTLPAKLKNIYILPRFNSTSFWSLKSYFDPSVFDHKINIVCAERDKLLAQKHIDSIFQNAYYDDKTCVIPDLYYVSDQEALVENPTINKTYEYGGMYYLTSTFNSTTTTLFGYVGKYVTKAIYDFSKINTSSSISFTDFNAEIVNIDEIYYYSNNSYSSHMKHFYANRLIHMDEYADFVTAHYMNYKEVYLHKLETRSYSSIQINESAATLETSYYLDQRVKGLAMYSKIENSEYLTGKINYYDASTISPRLEVTIEGVTATSENSTKSYTALVEEVVAKLGKNPFEDSETTKTTSPLKVPLIIIGTLGGVIIVYALYKVIAKSKSWLKD